MIIELPASILAFRIEMFRLGRSIDATSRLLSQTSPLAGWTSFWPKGLGIYILEWAFLDLKNGLAYGNGRTSFLHFRILGHF